MAAVPKRISLTAAPLDSDDPIDSQATLIAEIDVDNHLREQYA